MSARSVLKLLPIMLLGLVQVMGPVEVARSETMVQPAANQSQVINQLIQQLKAGHSETSFNAAKSLGQMGESTIPALIPLLSDQDAGVRWMAAFTLGQMRELAKSAIPDLIPLLKDQDMGVRSKVAFALGQIGESAKSAIPDLIPLLNDQNASVRSTAAEALGKMEESAKSAIPALMPLLRDQDAEVRSTATKALKKLGYKP